MHYSPDTSRYVDCQTLWMLQMHVAPCSTDNFAYSKNYPALYIRKNLQILSYLFSIGPKPCGRLHTKILVAVSVCLPVWTMQKYVQLFTVCSLWPTKSTRRQQHSIQLINAYSNLYTCIVYAFSRIKWIVDAYERSDKMFEKVFVRLSSTCAIKAHITTYYLDWAASHLQLFEHGKALRPIGLISNHTKN